MLTPQFLLDYPDRLVIDLFAGGGGASTGIEQAIGRHVDIAINHDADAIGMHEINHPQTRHYQADVWGVDPLQVTEGRPVGLLHASPDCTDHSQAKGGQPRRKEIRSLAWVVHKWAGLVRPDVITLENVEQMLRWSNLVAKRDKATGRVVTLDVIADPATGRKRYRVADPGERVPRQNQFLVADGKRLGTQWRRFVAGLRAMGYAVQWRVICNADLGAHSTRTRLYMIARRDGLPITWPAKTHAKKPAGKIKRHRPAADCIDWSIPGKSIFGRKKPLADATMRRIAYGLHKFVLDCPEPYIVNNMSQSMSRPVSDPIATVLASQHRALVVPTLVPFTARNEDEQENHFNRGGKGRQSTQGARHSDAGRMGQDGACRQAAAAGKESGSGARRAAATLIQMGYGERYGQAPRALDIGQPIGTVTVGGNKFAVAAAYMVQAGHGEGAGPTKRRSHGAKRAIDPIGTVTASGSGGHSLAMAYMVQANGGYNATPARDLRRPMSAVTATGSQQQLITAHVASPLSAEHEADALRCAAFLMRYHSSGGQWASPREPMTTITTKDRLALVTVWLRGEPWVIVDICLRMLTPRELYNAQDFPARYVIDRTAAGKALTKTAQVRMCGNSVCPLAMRLVVAANYQDIAQAREKVA